MLIEKYREGPKELYCVFVYLEKAYDKVLFGQKDSSLHVCYLLMTMICGETGEGVEVKYSTSLSIVLVHVCTRTLLFKLFSSRPT